MSSKQHDTMSSSKQQGLFSSLRFLLPPTEASVPTRVLFQQARSSSLPYTTSFASLQENGDSFRRDGSVSIWLDAQERLLFDTLVACATAFNENPENVLAENNIVLEEQDNNDNKPPALLQLRVAGGWVRDKILGWPTKDVDIAVQGGLSGVEFATLVQNHLNRQRLERKQQGIILESAEQQTTPKKKRSSSIAVIAANPSQSKHLETATMTVHGLSVDFVPLRAQEVYTQHSRIPTVDNKGSPEDDAARRDFTMNALYFHLQTRHVEDYSRRGLADLLLHKRIVTPMKPHSTFADDPLRMLRAIRFAVRYGFELDVPLERACVCPTIHKALHVKVSRERVGTELEGMLSGKRANPVQALQMIARLKLGGSVFCIDVDNNMISGQIMGREYRRHNAQSHLRELGWEEARRLIRLLPRVLMECHDMFNKKNTTNIESRLLHLGVFLLPFRHLTFVDHKHKTQTIVSHMIRHGIKFKNKDIQGITTLMENVDTMAETIMKQNVDWSQERLSLGLLLRSTKELWLTCLLMATVLAWRQEQQKQQQQEEEAQAHQDTWFQPTEEQQQASSLSSFPSAILQARALYRAITHDLKLDFCWTMKPLMDGKQVIESLQLPRGPMIGTYLEEQVKWMLMNPDGSKEECQVHLQNVHKRRIQQQDNSESNGSDAPLKHISKKVHVERMDVS